jgi:predicted translation initiation factor SUI1
MPQPHRTILFVATDLAPAQSAATAFTAVANRMGFPWAVRTGRPTDAFGDATVVVAVDDPPLPDWPGRVERLRSADLDSEVTKLLARLLGGRDTAVSPPPPPAPVSPASGKPGHTVKLSRETAGRRGKGVTVVSDLPLTDEQLRELATRLKTLCGSGGTAKDGRIEIQGDHRDKLASELEKLGYTVKRTGG